MTMLFNFRIRKLYIRKKTYALLPVFVFFLGIHCLVPGMEHRSIYYDIAYHRVYPNIYQHIHVNQSFLRLLNAINVITINKLLCRLKVCCFTMQST